MENLPRMKRAAVSLPDELILEILVRLNHAPALFRCATVSKQWRRLVASPSFLRSCWPEESRAAIAGFFTREQRDGQPLGAPCFVPAPRSAMGRGCRALSSFVKPVATGGQTLDRADPLVSRHGLLLVRLSRHADGADPDLTVVHLAVCDLLAGECHVLPPITCGRIDHWSGYAILSSTDCSSGSEQPLQVPSSNSRCFKVVIIDLDYNLYTYSSGQASWGTPTICLPGVNTRHYIPVSHGAAVVCRGTARWLFYSHNMSCLCTIDMEVETGLVSLTTIPLEVDYTCSRPCLTLAVDGTISLIDIQREWLELTIRKIVDETAELIYTGTIKLKEPGKTLTGGISNLYMLEEKYGTMVVYGGHSGRMYVADLETETMEELIEWPRHNNASRGEIVPLQMDWFTFFLSRLGSQ